MTLILRMILMMMIPMMIWIYNGILGGDGPTVYCPLDADVAEKGLSMVPFWFLYFKDIAVKKVLIFVSCPLWLWPFARKCRLVL
jgi:hypothetical protein